MNPPETINWVIGFGIITLVLLRLAGGGVNPMPDTITNQPERLKRAVRAGCETSEFNHKGWPQCSLARPDMFIERPAPAKQEALDL